jgi:hypothetical protein
MPQTPPDVFSALCAALCELCAVQVMQFEILLTLLRSKGFVTTDEWDRAKNAVRESRKAEIMQDLSSKLQERIAHWMQQPNAPPGSVH